MAARSSDGSEGSTVNRQQLLLSCMDARCTHQPGRAGPGAAWLAGGAALVSLCGLRVSQGVEVEGVEIQGPMGTERMEGSSSRRVIVLLGESAGCGAI